MNAIRSPRGVLLAGLAALVLASCGRTSAPTDAPAGAPSATATDQGADHSAAASARPEGIAWFEGSLDAAFAAAKAANQPVLLYWGAAWCPPCHLLKATVFAQPEFQGKAKLFVPVYLDGDDAGGQQAGDRFKVSGYPTLVALRPDGTEIKRISGGLDLNRYASMLDDALEDQRPAQDVLAAVSRAAAGATAQDCRRIAWNAWDLDDAFIAREPALATQLLAAASHCTVADDAAGTGSTLELRLRLYAAAALVPKVVAPATVAAFDANSQANAKRLETMLADPAAAALELDALRNLDAPFFAAYSRHDEAAAQRLAALAESAVLKAAQDARYPRADQLGALLSALKMRKTLAGDDAQQAALEKHTRARLPSEMADLPKDPYLRSGVVMAVLEAMYEMGDYEPAYDIAKREVESSPYAYYFMSDMGHICEQLGRTDESLQWYERGYRESKGPATRFQWGTSYMLALLRMAPDNLERIRAAGHEVLAELDQQGGAHRRSRTRLNRLDAKLTEWSAAKPAQRGPVAKDLRSDFAQIEKS